MRDPFLQYLFFVYLLVTILGVWSLFWSLKMMDLSCCFFFYLLLLPFLFWFFLLQFYCFFIIVSPNATRASFKIYYILNSHSKWLDILPLYYFLIIRILTIYLTFQIHLICETVSGSSQFNLLFLIQRHILRFLVQLQV